ncbi:hypothetical protein MRX96_003792 [Rhipicephalus microplus]
MARARAYMEASFLQFPRRLPRHAVLTLAGDPGSLTLSGHGGLCDHAKEAKEHQPTHSYMVGHDVAALFVCLFLCLFPRTCSTTQSGRLRKANAFDSGGVGVHYGDNSAIGIAAANVSSPLDGVYTHDIPSLRRIHQVPSLYGSQVAGAEHCPARAEPGRRRPCTNKNQRWQANEKNCAVYTGNAANERAGLAMRSSINVPRETLNGQPGQTVATTADAPVGQPHRQPPDVLGRAPWGLRESVANSPGGCRVYHAVSGRTPRSVSDTEGGLEP